MEKQLYEILYTVGLQKVIGNTYQPITNIQIDSRKLEDKGLFAALIGTHTDGHDYITAAIDKGATAILCEKLPTALADTVTYLQVKDVAIALGKIAANFYDHPSTKLKLVGVTGTNGKTTTTTLLFKLFRSLKYNVGLISTIQYQINESVYPSTHTTPDVLSLNRLLANMVEEGCEYCFIEVSSHAMVQKRVASIQFTGGVFSNLSHDHLDYHGSFKEYLAAKKSFFDGLPKEAFALSNIDDRRGHVMLQNTKATKQTYALKNMADFKVKILENNFTGLVLQVDGIEVHSLLIGEFNAYNLLAVYATAILLEEEKTEVLTALSKLTTAEGRFDYVRHPSNTITGIIDYAHTPDALLKVLTTIDTLRTKNEQLITIVGCGGDRDKTKRPVMAKVACEWSDKVFLTSDNPRTEQPETIIEDMAVGVPIHLRKRVSHITDRKEAIKQACQMAKKGDIILLAGKGHEKYQEINKVKYPFDDKKILQEALSLYVKV